LEGNGNFLRVKILSTINPPRKENVLMANCLEAKSLPLLPFFNSLPMISLKAIPANPPLMAKRNIQKKKLATTSMGNRLPKNKVKIAIPRNEKLLRYTPRSRIFFLNLCVCIKLLIMILKTQGAPSITEYKIPNIIFDSVRLETSAGKTVLKSSIAMVRARNAPCQINIVYVLNVFLVSSSN